MNADKKMFLKRIVGPFRLLWCATARVLSLEKVVSFLSRQPILFHSWWHAVMRMVSPEEG